MASPPLPLRKSNHSPTLGRPIITEVPRLSKPKLGPGPLRWPAEQFNRKMLDALIFFNSRATSES
jgi:hypothetical protein